MMNLPKGKKTNHKKGIAARARARRRAEAAERQAAYDKLKLDKKIARAKVGSREYNRLMGVTNAHAR